MSEDEKIVDNKAHSMPDETGELEAYLCSIDSEREAKNVEASLDQFEEDLKKANLTDKTIRRHVSNAALYLDWLTQHEGCPVTAAHLPWMTFWATGSYDAAYGLRP